MRHYYGPSGYVPPKTAIKHTPERSTPGPWKYEFGMVFDECGHGIAKADRDEPATTPTERDANARLISLAWMLPEIVEALTKAQELMLYNGWAVSTNPRYSEFYAQVKDVLARYHEQAQTEPVSGQSALTQKQNKDEQEAQQ